MRPTADRVRETLFNWLMHDIVSAHCLDLFAGTGILGLEALSRGAAFVSFIEQDKVLTQHLKGLLQHLTVTAEEMEVISSDALYWLDKQSAAKRYDIAFVDPPFAFDIYPILNKIAENKIMNENAIVYIEQGEALVPEHLPKSWHLYKHQKNGQVHYHLIRCGR